MRRKIQSEIQYIKLMVNSTYDPDYLQDAIIRRSELKSILRKIEQRNYKIKKIFNL